MRLFLFICCCIFLHSLAQAGVVRTPPLIQAVQGERLYFLQQLIKGGAEVNAIDAWGRTAAHYAVLRNNLPALEFLLTHGADPNLADNDGNALLDVGHEHKNEKMLELLREAGAKSARHTEIALQPAQDTAVSQPLSADKVTVPEDSTENIAQDLFQAAANNDRDSAERLLAAGADAKAKNNVGQTPFAIAIEAEHYALAAILLKAVAGINGRDEKSWTPLNWAIFDDDWDLVREFIRAGAYLGGRRAQNALDVAKSMQSAAKLIEVFITENGVDATVGENDKTMLILAAQRGNTEIVKLLIAKDADINIQENNYGYTALMMAAYYGYTEIVKLLVVARGANPSLKDRYGSTAFDYAHSINHQEIADIIRAAQQQQATSAESSATQQRSTGHEHKNKKMLELLREAGAKSARHTEIALQPAQDTAVSQPLNADKVVVPENKTENIAQDLFQAAANNDRDSAERLLAAGADAAAKNNAGQTPFAIAIETEHYALAAILLKAVAGINGRDEKSWTPLNWAILSDDWDLVREFIRAGAYLGGRRAQNALDVATLMESEYKLIEVFIAEQGVATVGSQGDPLLRWAASQGHTEVVELLVAHNADLNIQADDGKTALIQAVRRGHMEIVELLVAQGADLNIQENFGYTALMLAASKWHSKGHTEIVELLVAQGADVNIQNNDGSTVLIQAIRKGQAEIVKSLVAQGADLNIQNNDGNTALILAARNENTDAAKLLIDNGADPNIRNNNGDTALIKAALLGHTETAKLLVENSADLNIQNNDGDTALIVAARNGHTETAKLLIAHGANLNIKSRGGETALDVARKTMKKGRRRMIALLQAAQSE